MNTEAQESETCAQYSVSGLINEIAYIHKIKSSDNKRSACISRL